MNGECGYLCFSFSPRARNANQIVEARSALFRIFWNQEDFAGLGAGTGMGLGQCRRSKDVK